MYIVVYIVCLRYSIHLTYRVSIEKNANSHEHGLLAQLWLDNLKWIAERFQGSQPPNAAHNQWKSDFFFLSGSTKPISIAHTQQIYVNIYIYIPTMDVIICYGMLWHWHCTGCGDFAASLFGPFGPLTWQAHLFWAWAVFFRPMFTAHLYPLFHVYNDL